MTVYAFNETAGTTLESITGGSLLAGSTGIITDLVTDGAGAAENSNNFSIVGIFKTGANRSKVTLPTDYAGTSTQYSAAAIACDGSDQGYIAFLSDPIGTSYQAVTLRKNNVFLANLSLSTAIDVSAGEVGIDLYLSGSDVTVEVTQSGSAYETVSHTDGTPLVKNGSGLRIARDSYSPKITSWDDNSAGDVTAPVLSSPTATPTSSTTASGSVTTDEANGTLYYYASANASETAATIKSSGSSQAVGATGAQAVSFTGLTASTAYYAHYVHDDASANESNVVSSAQFTTPAPSLTVDSISDTAPQPGDSIVITVSNKAGTITAGDYTITAQDATTVTVTVPDPTTFTLTGETYPTLPFETNVSIPLNDGVTTANAVIQIQVPTGDDYTEITSIASGGFYANDVGVTAGMFGYVFDVVGTPYYDTATGAYTLGDGDSFNYRIYNGEWGSSATVGESIISSNPYSVSVLPPTGYSYVILTGIDENSWLNDPDYIANAGGDANNISIGDQIVYQNTTNEDGTAITIDSTGLPEMPNAVADGVTTNQTINWFYLDAQDGYAAGPMATLTLVVPETINTVNLDTITNTQINHALSVTVDPTHITVDLGSISNSQTVQGLNVSVGKLPINVELGNTIESKTVYGLVTTVDNNSEIIVDLSSINLTKTVHPLVTSIVNQYIQINSENPFPSTLEIKSGEFYDVSQHIINPNSTPVEYTIRNNNLQEGVSINSSTGRISFSGTDYATINLVIDVNPIV